MLNRVILIGRLTRDPELRYTPSGVAVTRFTVAVGRRYSNQQGEREADFISTITWRGLAENCANYLKKGSMVSLEGRIQTGKYEKEGRTVYTTEVVADDVRFLDPRNARPESSPVAMAAGVGAAGASEGGFGQHAMDDPFANDGKPIDLTDDDLPF